MAGPSLEQMQADKGFQKWATDTGLQKQSDGSWYNPARDIMATVQQENPDKFAPVAGMVYDIQKNADGKPLSYNPLITSANIGEKQKRWADLGLQWGNRSNPLYEAGKSADAETAQQLQDAGYTQGERFTTGTGDNAYKYYDSSGRQATGAVAQGMESDRQNMAADRRAGWGALANIAERLGSYQAEQDESSQALEAAYNAQQERNVGADFSGTASDTVNPNRYDSRYYADQQQGKDMAQEATFARWFDEDMQSGLSPKTIQKAALAEGSYESRQYANWVMRQSMLG